MDFSPRARGAMDRAATVRERSLLSSAHGRAGQRRHGETMGRRFQRGVVSFFSFLSALFFGAVVGLTAAIVAAYMLVDCAGLLAFIDAPLGRSIGEATATVGWSSLAVFSLLAGLTLGAEVYLGVAQSDLPRHGPTPAWLRALWAAAGQLWVSDTRGNGFHLV